MVGGASIERTEPRPGVAVLQVSGDVDLGDGSRLSREIAAAQADGVAVVVDLSPCTFLDSSGLSALIRAGRAAEAPHRFAVVCPDDGVVRRVFKLTRAYDLLEVHPQLDRALAAVDAGAAEPSS